MVGSRWILSHSDFCSDYPSLLILPCGYRRVFAWQRSVVIAQHDVIEDLAHNRTDRQAGAAVFQNHRHGNLRVVIRRKRRHQFMVRASARRSGARYRFRWPSGRTPERYLTWPRFYTARWRSICARCRCRGWPRRTCRLWRFPNSRNGYRLPAAQWGWTQGTGLPSSTVLCSR